MLLCGIYAIDGPEGFRYIGQSQSISERWYNHLRSLHNGTTHSNTDIGLAWKKYGPTAFSFKILEVCSFIELNDKEQYWISKWPIDKQYNGPSKEKPSRKTGYIKLSDGQLFAGQTQFAEACGYSSATCISVALSRGDTHDKIAKRRGIYKGDKTRS